MNSCWRYRSIRPQQCVPASGHHALSGVNSLFPGRSSSAALIVAIVPVAVVIAIFQERVVAA